MLQDLKLVEPDKRRKLRNRLRRVAGQVNAVAEMVEENDDCRRIAEQISAARGALERAYYELMVCAIQTGVQRAIDEGQEIDAPLEELTSLMARYA